MLSIPIPIWTMLLMFIALWFGTFTGRHLERRRTLNILLRMAANNNSWSAILSYAAENINAKS